MQLLGQARVRLKLWYSAMGLWRKSHGLLLSSRLWDAVPKVYKVCREDKKLNILYEDKDVLVVEKPQGVPSQEDKTGDKDMLSLVKEHIGKNNKNVTLLHRLDRPVGGIMLFPKSEIATKKLNEDIKLKNISKVYLAIVCGASKSKEELKDYVLKNGRLNTSKIVQKGTPNAKEAILFYETLDTVDTEKYGQLSLVKIQLTTGRHHQIRVQFSSRDLAVWGDTKYKSSIKYESGFKNIALWSYKLGFKHPVTNEYMEFKFPPQNIYPFNIENFKLYYS